jgi:hypothetical protein
VRSWLGSSARQLQPPASHDGGGWRQVVRAGQVALWQPWPQVAVVVARCWLQRVTVQGASRTSTLHLTGHAMTAVRGMRLFPREPASELVR